MTAKTYSNGEPGVSYFYDQASYNGLSIVNGVGRRTGMSDSAGATAWSYDSMGRPDKVRRTTTGVTKNNVIYEYNFDGSTKSITYPSGRKVTYEPNTAAQALSAVDSTNSVNYALQGKYMPHGALHRVVLGSDHGNAGTTLTQSFNNRLQPVRFWATNPSRTAFDLNFSFDGVDLGGHPANNGNVIQITNNLAPTRTQNFTYDELNRVKTAQAGSLWGNQFVYDIWGNLLQKNLTAGTGESLTLTVDANNHIQSFIYDAAGNLTNDGINTYTFDAENRMAIANNGTVSITFKYDGDGQRVQKSGYRSYWMGVGTEPLAETFTTGTDKREYVYFAGRRIALVDLHVSGNNCQPTCARYYFYSDHLGSGNVVTSTSGGTTVAESDYYPFGGERVVTSSSINPHFKFTGKELDPESGLYYFGSRYYSTRLGRFMSVDPENATGFEFLDNPQSWNAYSYAFNNPLRLTDPNGDIVEICHSKTQGPEATTDCARLTDDEFRQFKQATRGLLSFSDDGVISRRTDDGYEPVGTFRQIDVDLDPQQAELIRRVGILGTSELNTALPFFVSGGVGGGIAKGILGRVLGKVLGPVGARAGILWYRYKLIRRTSHPALKNVVKMIYQTSDRVKGGTAGAVRHELRTGQMVGGHWHSDKARQMINALNNLERRYTLSASDKALINELRRDLQNALQGLP